MTAKGFVDGWHSFFLVSEQQNLGLPWVVSEESIMVVLSYFDCSTLDKSECHLFELLYVESLLFIVLGRSRKGRVYSKLRSIFNTFLLAYLPLSLTVNCSNSDHPFVGICEIFVLLLESF